MNYGYNPYQRIPQIPAQDISLPGAISGRMVQSVEQITADDVPMNGSVALTTFDNPFDPFEQFSDWFRFDVDKGYYSCAYLARIAKTSDQFSDQENDEEIERAIDEIVKHDFMNIYKKVKRRT